MNTPIPCMICNSTTDPFISGLYDDRFGYPGDFEVRRCRSCGLGQLQFPLPAEKLGSLYTDYYPRKYLDAETIKTGATFDGGLWARFKKFWMGTSVSCHFHAKPGEKVLDIGCGAGTSLLELRNVGAEAYGTEYDLNMKPIAEKLGLSISFSGSIHDAFPGISFDRITASQVIEHLPEPKKILSELLGRLSSEGKIIAAFPNMGSLNRKLTGKRWINWHVPYHLYFFSRKSLSQLARDSGFCLQSVRTITPTEWFKLQVLELLIGADRDRPSPIWNPYAVHSKSFLLLRKAATAFALICTPVLRVLDFFGLGDSFLVELTPLAPAPKTSE